jgi:competence protein ComEC
MNINKFIGLLTIIWCIVFGLWWHTAQVSQQDIAGEIATSTNQLEITFLDIGQGDATFITFTNGQQMLIDCAIDARILEALGRAMPFYDRTIDYIVVTHPDQDHYGGCIDVIDRYDIETIVYNGYEKEETVFYHAFMDAVESSGAELQILTEPTRVIIGETVIDYLYPITDLSIDPDVPGFDKETGSNNSSIVIYIDHGDTEILLTGDGETELEEFLLREYGMMLDIDILKAGHHGSSSSSIEPFVEVTTPSHVVFSAGADNKYGHPTARVLKRFERTGSTVWRTDIMGDIVVTVEDERVIVNGQEFEVDKSNN